MKTILTAGVLLGLLIVAWTFVMGFTGWYKDPTRVGLFYVVMVIEIVGIAWALRYTAAQGRHYGGQVVAGTSIALVAAVLAFGGSLLFTAVAFPHYFEEIRAIQEQMLRQGGMPEDEVQRKMAAYARNQTSLGYALTGAAATVITGLVASLVVAVFTRAKRAG